MLGVIEFQNCSANGARNAKRFTVPKALTKLGLDADHWSAKVKGIGDGHWRVVAELEDLIDRNPPPNPMPLS